MNLYQSSRFNYLHTLKNFGVSLGSTVIKTPEYDYQELNKVLAEVDATLENISPATHVIIRVVKQKNSSAKPDIFLYIESNSGINMITPAHHIRDLDLFLQDGATHACELLDIMTRFNQRLQQTPEYQKWSSMQYLSETLPAKNSSFKAKKI